MITKTCPTYEINIYMAGDIEQAKQLLRTAVYPPNKGLCVTINSTLYIYTGGEETGFIVGLRNYPRFPSHPAALLERAEQITENLLTGLCQWSAMIVESSGQTYWITRRLEENTN